MKGVIRILACSGLLISLVHCEPEGFSAAEQLAKDIELIDEYLANNDISAMTDPSGLRFVIHEQGSGETPTVESEVTVSFEGRFLDTGEIFDASDGVIFNMNNLINAWKIGIPKIQPGGSVTLYAPSGLCFGKRGSTAGSVVIPANANLIFDIDLIRVR